MKRFLLKTFAVVIVVGIAYVLFFSIEKTDPSRICAVQDLRSNTIVRVVAPVAGNYAFVWQGSLPWWFLIIEMPAQRTVNLRAKVALPDLQLLKGDYYHIWLPLGITYRINHQLFADAAKLGGNGNALDDLVKQYFENELQREMAVYLTPYQREALAVQLEPIMERVKKNLKSQFTAIGIELRSVRISGNAVLPDRAVYNEGMAHAAELRKLDRMKELDLIGVRSTIEREKVKNEEFYARLLRISGIIRSNPDILKYIYIDKLGGNVNVILSSDNSGIPRMLEKVEKPAKEKPKEIDNLR